MSKRIFDIFLASFLLLLLALPMMVLAFFIRSKLGRPVLFQQERPGLFGRSFTMYKFRSMSDQRDTDGNLLPDIKRLTPFGRFLRSTSLDELPELWNVLKGDMSMVGPRPLLVEYLPLYSEQQARRHEALPGITGWAQVNGRNAISWEEKFELDVWYVDNQNMVLDLKIVFMTIKRVFRREGVTAKAQSTCERFMGRQSSDK